MSMDPRFGQPSRGMGYQMPQAPDDEDTLFSQGFSDLAYRALGKSNPDLLGEVVTFRVLDTDASKGLGVGAFILKHNQDIFLVPCVVSDNAVKPLDMFYSRRLDKFFPLDPAWMAEASKGIVNQLGTGVEPPKTLQTDVDIRNLVVPPTTGRYSYASADDDATNELCWSPFVAAALNEKVAATTELYLPLLLRRAPNHVKVAFAKVLQKNPRLLEKAAQFYGSKTLGAALELVAEKTAKWEETPQKHDLFIATAKTSPDALKKGLDPLAAGAAFQAIRTSGFYVKDERKGLKSLYDYAEKTVVLTEPKASGVYRVFLQDGSIETAVIIHNPKSFHSECTPWNADRRADTYLVLFSDGRYAELYMTDLCVEPMTSATHEDAIKLLEKVTTAKPSNKERGVLLCTTGLQFKALESTEAQNVTEDSEAVRFTAEWNFGSVTMSKKLEGSTCLLPNGGNSVVVSKNFRWFKCGKRLSAPDFLRNEKQIWMAIESELLKGGAKKLDVKKARSEGFVVASDGVVRDVASAAEKVASLYEVSVYDATRALTAACAGKSARLFSKVAAGPQPGGDQFVDPNAPPAPPPGPSGLDLAVSEQVQNINAQIAALQQQSQTLMMVQQRAQQIDQGGGAMAAPSGAAAMMGGPNPAQGGAPAQPPAGPPAGPQGAPSPQGAPQGAPPGPPGGGDPSAGAGVQPGGSPMMAGMQGDPNANPPPPPPVMTDNPTPDSIAGQINPDFLNQAGDLDQAGVFDAAAVASLAKQKNLKDLTQNYIPTLERALDNLGRVLLLFNVRESLIKQQIGNDLYVETEDKLREVFRGLGDALLKITQTSDQLLPSGGRTA